MLSLCVVSQTGFKQMIRCGFVHCLAAFCKDMSQLNSNLVTKLYSETVRGRGSEEQSGRI